MSRQETSPGAPQPSPSSLFNQDGQLDESMLAEQYGLGVAEASQRVKFGSYEGTVAEMLDDARCPVGGMMRNAYQEGGIDGVVQKFQGLSMLDSSFQVAVSQETIDMHKKKPQGGQIFPPTQSQNL